MAMSDVISLCVMIYSTVILNLHHVMVATSKIDAPSLMHSISLHEKFDMIPTRIGFTVLLDLPFLLWSLHKNESIHIRYCPKEVTIDLLVVQHETFVSYNTFRHWSYRNGTIATLSLQQTMHG